MTHALAKFPEEGPPAFGIVIEAARCWREARDRGQPTQPSLFAKLEVNNCAILAPVFDSLLTLCEAAIGRVLRTGDGPGRSQDERFLLDLLTTPEIVSNWPCAGKTSAVALGGALCSTNIMMRMALSPSLLAQRLRNPTRARASAGD